jgi:serine protease SohB
MARSRSALARDCSGLVRIGRSGYEGAMDILHDALGFAAKGFIVFATVAAISLFLAALFRRSRAGGPWLRVTPLNKQIEALGDALRAEIAGKKEVRKLLKARKKARADRANVFVLDFKGDLFATAVRSLREEVSAINAVAGKEDEVVVRLESAGGAVPHYGLAAGQLLRLREKGVRVTVCIDRIAASGGYLMACVADRIVAAPFAIIGSIGVVAQVPNLHRLLKKHDVDFQEMTAGEFKRTVSVFGEITERGRKKFQEELEDTHVLFKEFVKAQRPNLDLEKVATGEHWLARRGLDLGLVDQLHTSDEYLVGRAAEANLYRVRFERPGTLRERLGRAVAHALDRSIPWSMAAFRGEGWQLRR